MASLLGHVMANIIMNKLENTIIKPLINNCKIKFHCRYVDDRLFVVKPRISCIKKLLSGSDKIWKFKNKFAHCLGVEMSPDGISSYQKDNNTGLSVNYTNFVPWSHHTEWVNSFVIRDLKIFLSNSCQKS